LINNVKVKQVVFSPQENIENFIIKNIDKSKQQLRIMAFWFTWEPFAKAVVRAYNRGVDVKMILDARSLEKKRIDVSKEEIEVVPYFTDHGLGDKIKIYSGELFHYKVILSDYKNVMNGSCNFFNASLKRHEENYMMMESSKLYSIFLEQFENLWENK
tara:strand:- start:37 stop:510 length:474 start_codon:yes stop_codon:yes gene_type:complete